MKITMHTLAISEAWILIGPTPIQRREPFTSRPTPGTSTRIRNANPISSNTPLYCSQALIGTCNTTAAASRAASRKPPWRTM
jgi:hypothetical protein